MPNLVASDGVSLYVESHGSGLPIVFSCGVLTTHENFRSQVDPLVAAGYRPVLWDYRGHGKSDAPEDPERYAFSRVIEDLGEVLNWVASDRPAVLAGLSFGGLVSLHFAYQHPEMVAGLILMDSGPGFKNEKAQAGWTAQCERTAFVLESRGLDPFVSGKGAPRTTGRDPGLAAAKAAAAAIAAQSPSGLAHFERRVVAVPSPIIDE